MCLYVVCSVGILIWEFFGGLLGVDCFVYGGVVGLVLAWGVVGV